MAKKLDMQAALMAQADTRAPVMVRKAPAPANEGQGTPAKAASTRDGKKHIGAWLHSDFDRGLLLVMAKSPDRPDKQTLIAEALNDLFRKHNVPVVNL
jgi:hypothetical protein